MDLAKRQYFEEEARVAGSPNNDSNLNPVFPKGAAVVSIGCGGGWVGEKGDAARFVGVDIDPDAREFRLERDPEDGMQVASGEALPFADGEFRFYMARVSLMYMNVDRALAEAHRVLAPGGQLWITAHDFNSVWSHFKRSVKAFRIKDIVYRSYVIANGVGYHLFGKVFPFPLKRSRMESFQTRGGLRRGLERAGFVNVEFPPSKNGMLLVTADNPWYPVSAGHRHQEAQRKLNPVSSAGVLDPQATVFPSSGDGR